MAIQIRSCTNIALCIMAVLMAASTTTHAQISGIPKRHRNNQEFGRIQQRQKGQQQQKQQQHEKKNLRRKMEGDFSMPLQESEFDMSIPLQELRLDLSMPLGESEFSMPMSMDDLPTQELEDSVSLDNGNSGSVFVLASFLAGITGLLIGAIAFVVKVRQNKKNQIEDRHRIRVVSFPSRDDEIIGMEVEERNIVIT